MSHHIDPIGLFLVLLFYFMVPCQITFVFGWVPPLPHIFHCRAILPPPPWELFLVGIKVIIFCHLSHQAPLACEEASLINLGIMKAMSTWIFIILTGYCHINSQRGGVPTYVWAGRPSNEGGVGGGEPNTNVI